VGLIDHLIESFKHWRRSRPKVSLVQSSYRSSGSNGCTYQVLVRNDGGSVARDVVVALLLNGDDLDAKTVSIPTEGEEGVHLLVPAARCDEPRPGRGMRAVGTLRFEARHENKIVAELEGRAE
jgi:hypothetical protein